MSRVGWRILAPYLVGGGILLVACVIGVGYVNRLDANMTAILADHMSSQLAARELESALHRLRYDHLAAVVAPVPDGASRVAADERAVNDAIDAVEATARSDDEKRLVGAIRAAFTSYLVHFDRVLALLGPNPLTNLGQLTQSGPIDDILRPTTELVQLNRQMAGRISADSQRTRDRIRLSMILIGVGGPLAGLACGYAVARSLGRSIHELSINVSDLSDRVGAGGSVTLVAGRGMDRVNEQIRHVIDRVQVVVGQMYQQERELIRAEQLATVGQLAATVAHEIRNPLSAVTILVTMATRSTKPVPLSAEDLGVISDALARVEKTVQGMLDLSRPARPQPVALDLRDAVRSALDLIRPRAGSQRVELDVAVPDGAVTVLADRGQLASVFVNLFMNALDEMKAGGRLDVRVFTESGSVVVTVGDTGGGIPSGSEEAVFEPFQTSKATGTGLGLHIARRVVEDHGGSIAASNRPPGDGTGAVFVATFPAAG